MRQKQMHIVTEMVRPERAPARRNNYGPVDMIGPSIHAQQEQMLKGGAHGGSSPRALTHNPAFEKGMMLEDKGYNHSYNPKGKGKKGK